MGMLGRDRSFERGRVEKETDGMEWGYNYMVTVRDAKTWYEHMSLVM